ncbi:MAG: cardiolipin synthase [Bacilli bacterium]|nr:cardiolipin synthase [Bacilli bacterium]
MRRRRRKKTSIMRLLLPKLPFFLLILAQFLGFLFLFIWIARISATANLGYALILLLFISDVACCLYIFSSKSASPFKLTWIMIVISLPIAGLVMYLAFANKMTKWTAKRSEKRWGNVLPKEPSDPKVYEELEKQNPDAAGIARLIERAHGDKICRGSDAVYFGRVEDAWPVILEEIRKAQHYIFVEFFIIHPGGEFYDTVLAELEKKVEEGVDVRFIYDDFGSLRHAPMLYWRELKARGIKGECFYPIRPLIDVRMNNRDHRKILDIDGHTCFTGGFNLSDEYVNIDKPFGLWKDNVIMVRGEAVNNFTRMFLENWVSSFYPSEKGTVGEFVPSPYQNELPEAPSGTGFIQPYGDIPFDGENMGEKIYLAMIGDAKESFDVVTPYLILDEVTENALICAAERGTRVRILVPKIPDKRAVFNLTRSYYEKLLESGVEIYEFTPGFVHEKMAITDNRMASVGSINLDYRALYLDLQNGVFLVDDPSIKDMSSDFEEAVSRSDRISLETFHRWKKRNRFYWAMLRVIAPML